MSESVVTIEQGKRLILDRQAKKRGFEVVDSGLMYCKPIYKNVDLYISDRSWYVPDDKIWRADLKLAHGGMYVAEKQVIRCKTLQEVLDVAKQTEFIKRLIPDSWLDDAI